VSRLHTDQSILLSLRPNGESFQLLTAFGSTKGLFSCLKRQSKKASQQSQLDHFDTVELTLETATGGSTQFVKEATVLQRRSAIGNSYRSLQFAADFAKLIVNNAAHLPDPDELFKLCTQTMDAFNAGKAPEIVYLKGLYLVLQGEGYPMRESWWQQLPKNSKPIAKQLINHPSPMDADREAISTCMDITEDLQQWARRETELRV